MKTLFFQLLKSCGVTVLLMFSICPRVYAVSNIVLDGTTGTTTVIPTAPLGTGTQYTIDGLTNGTVNGANLFFSFSQFGISAGDTALFQCASCFSNTPFSNVNVIARVTGTTPTNIDGTLISTVGAFFTTPPPFTAANFWIFNPNGIIIGPGAVIDLGTTTAPGVAQPIFHNGDGADRIIFSDGAVFDLTTSPTSSTLTYVAGTANNRVPTPNLPVSFGFPPPPTIVITPDNNIDVVPTPAEPVPPIETIAEPIPEVTVSEVVVPIGTHTDIFEQDVNKVIVKPTVPVKLPPLPKKLKPCSISGESTLLNKGVANYEPQQSVQVPYGLSKKTNVNSEPALNIDDECNENKP